MGGLGWGVARLGETFRSLGLGVEVWLYEMGSEFGTGWGARDSRSGMDLSLMGKAIRLWMMLREHVFSWSIKLLN